MNKQRFWEVDFIRGIALVLMVVFHFMLTAYYFGVSGTNPNEGALYWAGRISGTLFVFLVGVSLTLSHARSGYTAEWQKYFTRGAYILWLGLFITIITAIFVPFAPIVFGVLHLIGISIIVSYPFLRFTWQNIIIGIPLIACGIALQQEAFGFPYLLPLGFMPTGFASLDYYPLMPWFGVVLFGICAGNLLYADYIRQFSLLDLSKNRFVSFISFLGRNTLPIYLLHEPIILALVFLIARA